MYRMLRIVVLSMFVLSVAAYAGDDPLIGTWKLNVAKSKFSPGPPLKSETITWETSGNGLRSSAETVDAQGRSTSGGYTASFDGKDSPWTGNPAADSITMKRINASTTESTWKKGGKVTIVSRRVVSKDGKTLTITQKGKNAQGQPVNNVAVYDKLSMAN